MLCYSGFAGVGGNPGADRAASGCFDYDWFFDGNKKYPEDVTC